jgi:hypothetical protein
VRGWIHGVLGLLLFVASATASIWALQLGWALAVFGLAAAICGVIWRLVSTSTLNSAAGQPRGYRSGGLIWPGAGLLVAPFANVFILMPVLRQLIH